MAILEISTDLDLFDEQVINITRRAKDFSDIRAKEGEFTRTFAAPATRKNQAAVQNYGVVGTASDFNPHNGIAASWAFSTFTKFVGRLELLKVVYKDGSPYSFEFVFYGKQRSLATVFSGDRLSDIDWSAYDHVLTYFNVISSWQGNLDGSDDLLYPLIDTRVNYYFGDPQQNIKGNILNSANAIRLADLKPAIRLGAFLQTIFANYGLQLAGDLVNNPFSPIAKEYLLINRFSGQAQNATLTDDNFCHYSAANSATITAIQQGTAINFSTLVQDNNSLFASPVYTAGVAGQHTLNFQIIASMGGAYVAGKYRVEVQINGQVVQFFDRTQTIGGTGSQLVWLNSGLNLELNVGDQVRLVYRKVPYLFGTFNFSGRSTQIANGFFTLVGPLSGVGQTVSLNDQMTDDKIVDWLGDFLIARNWRLQPDPLRENLWNIYTREEWLALGVKRDWKPYIDLDNITYAKPKVYKEVQLRYAQTEAAVQAAFRSVAGRQYGDLIIRPDIEFGDDVLEIENPCALIPPALYRQVDVSGQPTGVLSDITIHKSLNTEGQPCAEPYLLFYYLGVQETTLPYWLQTGLTATGITQQLMQIYPHVASVSQFPALSSSLTLCYSLESSLLGDIATQTEYKRSWEDEIQIQYAKESRVIEGARIVIPILQFYQYQMNDEIFLENNWWRIEEISHDLDGRNAIIRLMSSRKLRSAATGIVSQGGLVTFDVAQPDGITKSAYGAYQKNGDWYASFLKVQVQPLLLKYTDVLAEVNNNFTQQIQEIAGKIRIYDEVLPPVDPYSGYTPYDES
jgi:hypothetical protein